MRKGSAVGPECEHLACKIQNRRRNMHQFNIMAISAEPGGTFLQEVIWHVLSPKTNRKVPTVLKKTIKSTAQKPILFSFPSPYPGLHNPN